MKKLLVGALAALVLSLTLSAGAQAKCNLGCLNRKVRTLGTTYGASESPLGPKDSRTRFHQIGRG